MILALLLIFIAAAPVQAPAAQAAAPLSELLTRARDHIEAGDRAAARVDLDAALRAYPASPAVRNFLGVLTASEGGYEEAERHFKAAVQRDPRYTDAWLNLGRLYQENAAKDAAAPRKALAAYESVLRHEPAHREARFQSAALLQALGEFDRSQAELAQLPAEDREKPAALAVACANLAARGAKTEADAAAEKLLAARSLAAEDVRPVLPVLAAHGRDDLVVRIVETLRQKGARLVRRPRGARRRLREAAASGRSRARRSRRRRHRGPTTPALLLALARVAYEQKDLEGALGYLGHARAVEPAATRASTSSSGWSASRWTSAGKPTRLSPRRSGSTPTTPTRTTRSAAWRFTARTRRRRSRTSSGTRSSDRTTTAARTRSASRTFSPRTTRPPARSSRRSPRGRRPPPRRTTCSRGSRGPRARTRRPCASRSGRSRPTRAAPTRWSELGLLYQRLGQLDRAEEALDRCLEIDPNHYLGHLHLLMLYSRTQGPAAGRAAGALRRAEEEARGAGGRLPPPVEIRPY